MSAEIDIRGNDQSQPKKKSKKKMIGGLLLLGGIPLFFVTYLVLGPILDIMSKDISAKEMYVISESVNVRATKDPNSLKMGQLLYGKKVLVYQVKDDWAEVLVDGQKVFISSKFIVDPSVYYTIEGMFGDNRISNTIKSSKFRLALYRYYISKGFTSLIRDSIKTKFIKDVDHKEIFQIISDPKLGSYSSVASADFDGDLTQDAAFILKHKDADQKILVILSFDKKDPLNISKVIYENELEQPWMYIKVAKKGFVYNVIKPGQEPEKLKLPVNGLLIGSNRTKDFKDPVSLLYYNGQKFEMIKTETSGDK